MLESPRQAGSWSWFALAKPECPRSWLGSPQGRSTHLSWGHVPDKLLSSQMKRLLEELSPLHRIRGLNRKLSFEARPQPCVAWKEGWQSIIPKHMEDRVSHGGYDWMLVRHCNRRKVPSPHAEVQGLNRRHQKVVLGEVPELVETDPYSEAVGGSGGRLPPVGNTGTLGLPG